ncbi:MAG: CoA pyrophosphatase [Putridiphycobacter sp.]|nr:CoA pyrophosphatase [Putridiphycobacter sp.]
MKSLIESGAIYELIKKELQNLPGDAAHLEMIPYRTKESLLKQPNQPAKQSAVLCLLTTSDSHLNITLMERTKDGSPHSGQISFPGGKMEQTDPHLSHTALRETYEEIGIKPTKIELLGRLTSLYIPVSNFEVTPFIGFTHKADDFVLSKREVKSVFNISLDDLVHPANKTKRDIPNHLGQTLKNIPCFYINNKIIWGATALVLNEVRTIWSTIQSKI